MRIVIVALACLVSSVALAEKPLVLKYKLTRKERPATGMSLGARGTVGQDFAYKVKLSVRGNAETIRKVAHGATGHFGGLQLAGLELTPGEGKQKVTFRSPYGPVTETQIAASVARHFDLKDVLPEIAAAVGP